MRIEAVITKTWNCHGRGTRRLPVFPRRHSVQALRLSPWRARAWIGCRVSEFSSCWPVARPAVRVARAVRARVCGERGELARREGRGPARPGPGPRVRRRRALRLRLQNRLDVQRHGDGQEGARDLAHRAGRMVLEVDRARCCRRMLSRAARRRAGAADAQRLGNMARHSAEDTMSRVLRMLAAVLIQLAYAAPALAYRPFDSTDADVAKAGEFELEFGPVQRFDQGGKRFADAPAVVANFGLTRGHELVIETRREVALDAEPGEPRSSFVDNGVFIKQVLRRGILQDEKGPSVATEYGILLPDRHGDSGTGASIAGIVCQRGDAGRLRGRDPRGSLFVACASGRRSVRRARVRQLQHDFGTRRRHLARARRAFL